MLIECRRVQPADEAAFEHLQVRGYGSGRPQSARAGEPPHQERGGTDTAPASPPEPQDVGIGCFVDGEPLAGLYLRHYVTRWGSARIAMESVGGVVTVPEARRRGYTDRVLLHALEDMRARGVPLSTITTPFSYAFYRRAGWEYAFARHEVRLPTRALLSLADGADEGEIRFCAWEPGGTVPAALQTAYEAAVLARYQGAAERDRRLWEARLEGDRTYAYVWESHGAVRGYAVLSTPEDQALRVRELYGADAAARRSLLAFLGQFDSQADDLRWDAPPDDRIDLDVREQNELSVRWQAEGMLRLVDVPAAIAQRGYDRQLAGRVVLRLTDDRSPWNEGTWAVDWEAGTARVTGGRGATAGGGAEAAMDVRVLAQLYAGALSPEAALRAGMTEMTPEARRLLSGAFVTEAAPLLLEWF